MDHESMYTDSGVLASGDSFAAQFIDWSMELISPSVDTLKIHNEIMKLINMWKLSLNK